jgi:nucleolar protein 4
MKEELLRKELEKFGKVNLINLPKKENGSLKGYSMVTFQNMKEAKKAMDHFNQSDVKMMGKKVACDWCLPKNLFLKNRN